MKLDENGFAVDNFELNVYNYSRDNNEFISATKEYIVKGSGIPAQSTLIEVIEEKKGFARVFNEAEQTWEYAEDHRGEEVFSTINGSKVEIKELGVLPENTTYIPKPSGFHKWDGNDWIEDIEAKNEAQKQYNLAFLKSETRRVNDAIAPLDDAIEFDIATDEEVAQHKELRKYRLLLSRVPTQKEWPLNPTWPTCPEFFK